LEGTGGFTIKKHILIVDNEQAILLAFKKLFSTPNIKVDTVETMEEALEMLKKDDYDIVIADLRLTGRLSEEGLYILKYVKEHTPDAGVILITGYGNPDVQKRAIQLGVDYYFEKPVSTSVLRNVLKDLGMDYSTKGGGSK
jgi:DNA-binding NtrC family response regulator